MGCDIHFYVEKRNKETGKWELDGQIERDDEGDESYITGVKGSKVTYHGRNYNLFAILADVRNGRGFAGIKTGEGFNPISDPRGVPDDASEEYKAIVDGYGCDGHSHSYHTLRQLLDYDWTQETELQGWTDLHTYIKWKLYGSSRDNDGPERYCGGVSGNGIQHLSEDDAKSYVEAFKKLNHQERRDYVAPAGIHVLAQWSTPYHAAAADFFVQTMPKLLSLAGGTSGLDDVRAVFFFDN